MAIGQTIALARNENTTKVNGSDKFLPTILGSPYKENASSGGRCPQTLGHNTVTGHWGHVAHHFYYLLHIDEYTVKGKRKNNKQVNRQYSSNWRMSNSLS
jgi:hypothetical protein